MTLNVYYTESTTHTGLLALSLTAAILYAVTAPAPGSVSRMITKTAAISCLAILSMRRNMPFFLIAAQISSAIGDAFLVWEADVNFLCGLGSFLVGHLFYLTLFAQSGNRVVMIRSESWRQYTALALLVLSSGTFSLILWPRLTRDLRFPVLFYSVAIYTMVLTALTMAESSVIIGAIMFMTSDTILALQKFVVDKKSHHQTWMEYAVWVLYYAGQALIMRGYVAYASA